MSGRLVVVATPIGNLGDLSPRAATALRDADLVLAEDTRRTGRLLQHIGAETPQLSVHEHNEDARIAEVVARIGGGEVIALVSDAGTPAVSDPGYRLVRGCIESGVDVEHVPGASAVLYALVVAGLPTDRFVFEGFLPRKGRARTERLAALAGEPRTVVLFVAPHRAESDLRDLAAALGTDRPAALCRELTKLHEEIRRGTLGELVSGIEDDEGLRGEVTLVIGGAVPVDDDRTPEELAAEVLVRVDGGVPKKQAIADVASEAGVPKKLVYQAVLDTEA